MLANKKKHPYRKTRMHKKRKALVHEVIEDDLGGI